MQGRQNIFCHSVGKIEENFIWTTELKKKLCLALKKMFKKAKKFSHTVERKIGCYSDTAIRKERLES